MQEERGGGKGRGGSGKRLINFLAFMKNVWHLQAFWLKKKKNKKSILGMRTHHFGIRREPRWCRWKLARRV